MACYLNTGTTLPIPRRFGPKGKEEAGGSGRLHNEELHNLYASKNIIRA
jgi:hypothetical protein